MNQAKLAEARRLYHHVRHGGTLTPEDVSFMVVALEEAYERGEEPMINYIDCSDPPDMDKSGSLGDRQPEWANRMSDEEKNT